MTPTETWRAVRFEGVIPRGRTKPLIVGCERTVGAQTLRDVFVVKAIGNPEVTPELLCNELLGHFVARAFGCNTFEFALVDLSQEFIDANLDVFKREGVNPKAGLAFGTQRTEHVLPFAGRQPIIPKLLLPSAARVFALDMVLQNTDRHQGNHNCGMLHDRITLWDFDQAFGFRYPIVGGTPACFEVCKLSFRRQHVFYSSLRAQPIEWDWVADAANEVGNSIDHWHAALPDTWRSGARELLEAVAQIAPKHSTLVHELQLGLL